MCLLEHPKRDGCLHAKGEISFSQGPMKTRATLYPHTQVRMERSSGRLRKKPKVLAARAAEDSGLSNFPLTISLPGAAL